ncbi:hypothetical protein V2J09_009647 [Rumex salicifolius]
MTVNFPPPLIKPHKTPTPFVAFFLFKSLFQFSLPSPPKKSSIVERIPKASPQQHIPTLALISMINPRNKKAKEAQEASEKEEEKTMPKAETTAAATTVPPWLEPLLTAAFFSICRVHGDAARSECNMYCLDCPIGSAFCFYCRSSKHKDHQIRRSSYHDVVRVSEIQTVLDLSGVQTYVINSARVLFLNERPQPKAGKGVAHLCEICGRSLLDTFRFCSLGCKLVGVKRNGNASFALEGKTNEMAMLERERREEGMSSSMATSRIAREEGNNHLLLGGSSQRQIYPSTPPPPSSARRRKGIPHRAPLKS